MRRAWTRAAAARAPGTVAAPVPAVVVLALTWGTKDPSAPVVAVVGVLLAAAVLAAVHHAEVVAHRVGEPFGSLVLQPLRRSGATVLDGDPWLSSAMAADSNGLTLDQDLDVRVAEARGRLSGNDERILAFVREHLDELAFHTAESLAQGTGVSAAAVVRFSRRLGFASFRDMRERARAELQSGREPGSAAASPSTLGRKVQRDIASIELLPRMLEEPLARAAEAIAGARTTWFLANRETYGIAVYAQRLMHQVRADVRLVDPSFPDPLRGIGPEDVLVACTFRPYARLTLDLVAHARAARAQVVLLTDGRGHDFVDAGDLVLVVPVESPTMLLSFTPAVCVLEALAAQVAMLDADHTHDTLDATASFVADQNLVVERALITRPPRRPVR